MVDVRVEGPEVDRGEEILTPEALDFIADLQTRFGQHCRRSHSNTGCPQYIRSPVTQTGGD